MNEINLINLSVNDPIFQTIADALALAHDGEKAAQSAAEKAISDLDQLPPYIFTGSALQIQSLNRPERYDTDGEVCSCKGGNHPWCKHRAEYRILLAYAALVNPALLRAAILGEAQPEPQDVGLSMTTAPVDLGHCRRCGAYLLDDELPVGLCADCQTPPAAVALDIPAQRCPACGGKGGNCSDCGPIYTAVCRRQPETVKIAPGPRVDRATAELEAAEVFGKAA